jgi:hypothetical protein
MTEPKRPAPSSSRTLGTDWARLADDDPQEFEKQERELRESIRSRSNGDFNIW